MKRLILCSLLAAGCGENGQPVKPADQPAPKVAERPKPAAPAPRPPEPKPEPKPEPEPSAVAGKEAEIAAAYFAERNRRFLAYVKTWHERGNFKLLKDTVSRGPQRLHLNELPGQLTLQPGVAGYTKGLKVVQILGDKKVLVSLGDMTVMAVGWDTRGVVDGEAIRPRDAVAVSGTVDYTATTGANRRVYVIEPFDLSRFEADHKPDVPQEILNAVK